MMATTGSHSYSLRPRHVSSSSIAKSTSVTLTATASSMPPADSGFRESSVVKSTGEEASSMDCMPSKRRITKTQRSPEKLTNEGGGKRRSSAKDNVLSRTSQTSLEITTSRAPNGSSDIEDVPVMRESFNEEECASIRSGLLAWYDKHHRQMPWRRSPSLGKSHSYANDQLQQQRAYEVWISEVMLQQTRVATVILYYEKWMATWPTLRDLARATLEEVYGVWAGLGYYRRARHLLEGAQQIENSLAGVFPDTLAGLRTIPGIGNYTAGAIASIAFNMAAPVVDGNVIRVLCRLRAISDSPKLGKTVKLFWSLAEELVDHQRPGDYNQALMELGATLCTPTSPACSTCPVAKHCKALLLSSRNSNKSVTDYPTKVAKAALQTEYIAVCVLELSTPRDSVILVVQRPSKGLLAGLWEFPSVVLGELPLPREDQEAAMNRYLKECLRLDVQDRGVLKRREPLGTHVHVFSHIRWYMSVECLTICSPGLQKRIQEFRGDSNAVKWVPRDSVGGLGLTSSVQKIYNMYLESTANRQELNGVKR